MAKKGQTFNTYSEEPKQEVVRLKFSSVTDFSCQQWQNKIISHR
ncbi:hypothetical protein [Parageobacillus sp. VR-IP]|nr:hypothetical protein [Parageobacillus sp. VR-IP]